MTLREAAEAMVKCATALKKLDSKNPGLEQALTEMDCAEVDLETAFHQDSEAPSELRAAVADVIEKAATFRNSSNGMEITKTEEGPQISVHSEERRAFMAKLQDLNASEARVAEVLQQLG